MICNDLERVKTLISEEKDKSDDEKQTGSHVNDGGETSSESAKKPDREELINGDNDQESFRAQNTKIDKDGQKADLHDDAETQAHENEISEQKSCEKINRHEPSLVLESRNDKRGEHSKSIKKLKKSKARLLL